MPVAYVYDVSILLCNTVCMHVNLFCAAYYLLPALVFHSAIQLSKFIIYEHSPFF